MSWTTGRNTTPSEDREYALMGIFDVNIPILYGEGNERTFRRLHIEIIQCSYDTIIFAWGLRIALGLTRDSVCVAEGRVERWKYEREYVRSTNFLLPRLPDAFCVSIDLVRLPLAKLTSTLGTGMVDKPHFCYTHLGIGIPIPLCEVYSHERGRFCCAALVFCMSGSGASVNGAPPSKFIKLMLYRAHDNPQYFPNRNPVLRCVDGAAGTLSRVIESPYPLAGSGSPEWRVQSIYICAKAFG